MRRPVRLFALAAGTVALLGLLGLSGCVDSLEPDITADPHAPVFADLTTSISYPTQLAEAILTWSCSDPEGDPITYTLLFGEDRNGLTAIAEDYSGSTGTIGGLEPGKTWYWQVIATDSTGRISVSRAQQFKTVGGPIYPLGLGNIWGYWGNRWGSDFNFEPIPSTLADTTPSLARVTVEGRQWLDDTTLTEILRESSWSGEGILESRVWFANRPEGLFDYAESGTSNGPMPLKLVVGETGRPGTVTRLYSPGVTGGLGGLLPATGAGTAQYQLLDPPRRALAYPLTVGQFWTVFNNGDLMIKKLVTDSGEVETTAGKFDALEVTWRYYWIHSSLTPGTALAPGPEGQRETQSDDPDIAFLDHNMVVKDYIASIGLVKRIISFGNITATDYTGDPLGTYTFNAQWVLQYYSTAPPEQLPAGITVRLDESE